MYFFKQLTINKDNEPTKNKRK